MSLGASPRVEDPSPGSRGPGALPRGGRWYPSPPRMGWRGGLGFAGDRLGGAARVGTGSRVVWPCARALGGAGACGSRPWMLAGAAGPRGTTTPRKRDAFVRTAFYLFPRNQCSDKLFSDKNLCQQVGPVRASQRCWFDNSSFLGSFSVSPHQVADGTAAVNAAVALRLCASMLHPAKARSPESLVSPKLTSPPR